MTASRAPGVKVDVVVYADPAAYASFPQIMVAKRKVALLFQVQDLAKLKEIGRHPHYQDIAVPYWSVSEDAGLSWQATDQVPRLGKVLCVTGGSIARKNGRVVSITFSAKGPIYSLIEDGAKSYTPYGEVQTSQVEKHEITDYGPFDRFFPFSMTRTPNGKLIAAGYSGTDSPSPGKCVSLFLESANEGCTWKYLSHIADDNVFSLCEPAVLPCSDGRLMAMLRAEWESVPKEQWPQEIERDRTKTYGYFMYQSESDDGGRTWSKPVQTPFWGHPASLVQLKSGNVLMVWGVRRKPYSIMAVLSRNGGKTWDTSTVRTLHVFDPGAYDLGYPVAAQLQDGSIMCAYYGYSTANVGEFAPHGIFVSIFDEKWMQETGKEDTP